MEEESDIDVVRIVNYNNEEEIVTEYEHENVEGILLDDTVINNLSTLNIEDLLNIELNGNNHLKINF